MFTWQKNLRNALEKNSEISPLHRSYALKLGKRYAKVVDNPFATRMDTQIAKNAVNNFVKEPVLRSISESVFPSKMPDLSKYSAVRKFGYRGYETLSRYIRQLKRWYRSKFKGVQYKKVYMQVPENIVPEGYLSTRYFPTAKEALYVPPMKSSVNN